MKLSPTSLDWALAQALARGDTDIFPAAFEFKAVEHGWERLGASLAGQDFLHWRPRAFRRCLSPKHRYGFRIATQLDPLDFLMFTAAVYEVGHELEALRVGTDFVHSHRFKPTSDGAMFDPDLNYRTFTELSRDKAEDCGPDGFVVTADIADFYSRLYSHRVENALSGLSVPEHARAITKILDGWAGNYSYGIPIGCAATRLIAEATLDDVDRGLLAEGADYCRFSDDFRIFCSTNRQAHERLALLATILFENHGLTLQQHKTYILPVDDFLERTKPDASVEWQRFLDRLDDFGLGNPYGPIDVTDLPEDLRQQAAELNLGELLAEELQKDEVDISRTRFLLGRMAQFGFAEPLDDILRSIEKLYPVVPDVVTYVEHLPDLDLQSKHRIGRLFLDLARDSTVAHLEFHRMWLLSVFAKSAEWNNENALTAAYSLAGDDYTKRELMLALGVAKQATWFRTRKRSIGDLGPWLRRAFIYGASCLSRDERHHWYRSIGPQCDELDRAVARWAEDNPIG